MALYSFYQRIGKRLHIAGIAAGDDVAVDDDGPVHEVASRVEQVGPDGAPTSDGTAIHEARLDQEPRSVADRCNGLPAAVEVADEVYRRCVGAKRVRVADAARQDQHVE